MNEAQEGREGTSLHPVERKICLRFHEVSFSYGNLKVLDKVSFHIHQGEFIALAGPNGSGKTTALKLILGLEKPQGGTIELFGPAGPAGDLVGYVPQQAAGDRAFPISVEEVVMMGRLRPRSRRYRPEDREAAAAAMEELGIAALAAGGQTVNYTCGGEAALSPQLAGVPENAAALKLPFNYSGTTRLR